MIDHQYLSDSQYSGIQSESGAQAFWCLQFLINLAQTVDEKTVILEDQDLKVSVSL